MIAGYKLRTSFVLFGAPALWIAQMSLSESLSSYACYPRRAPLPEPLWSGLPQMLIAINILCLTGALLCAMKAWKNWRSTGAPASENHEATAQESRMRFLATLGLMSGILFFIAVLFTTCANCLVSPCTRWH